MSSCQKEFVLVGGPYDGMTTKASPAPDIRRIYPKKDHDSLLSITQLVFNGNDCVSGPEEYVVYDLMVIPVAGKRYFYYRHSEISTETAIEMLLDGHKKEKP
jgi:hypothetical protein